MIYTTTQIVVNAHMFVVFELDTALITVLEIITGPKDHLVIIRIYITTRITTKQHIFVTLNVFTILIATYFYIIKGPEGPFGNFYIVIIPIWLKEIYVYILAICFLYVLYLSIPFLLINLNHIILFYVSNPFDLGKIKDNLFII